MVLDEVWRTLDGVDALSGPQGGPLSRTVKLVLDPLVIRPVLNPSCAGSMLSADGAVLLATLVNAQADKLRATAAWYTLLKQVRRAARITEGNPQDLYFQLAFELASQSGSPDSVRGRAIAERALREVHASAAGRTTQALKEHLTDPTRATELTALIGLAWSRRPALGPHTDNQADVVLALLEECATARENGSAADSALDRLIDSHAGTRSGMDLWGEGTQAQVFGLTVYPLPSEPELGSSASTSTLGLPFDRTVYERVFTALQASTDRADLPLIPELVTTEIARSCAPWALLDESLRVAATAGAELAAGLRPLGTDAEGEASTSAHRVINRRWRREAYVLRARRLAVFPGDEFVPTASPLAVIAADLREPWRPYLRRLWVRLHGRDVRGVSVFDAEEVWDLLDGVARSVILDHRTRVKQALQTAWSADIVASTESRAS